MAGARGREDIICEVFGNGVLRWILSRVSYEAFLSSCSVSPVTSDWASPVKRSCSSYQYTEDQAPRFPTGRG